jgi:cell division protein FtsB
VSEQAAPAKRTASQRLDDIENALMQSFQTLESMARENQILKEAVKLLGNKLDAIVKASSTNQPLTDEVLSAIMVQNNVSDLEAKVNNLRDQGILAPEDTVTATSFVVGREVSATGEVVNPRLQFALSAVKEDFQTKLSGSKAGDVVILEDGKLSFEVLESYSIQTPPPAPASAAEAQVEA